MLPKRLKYYQAYDINFGGMADAYAKNLLINNSGIGQGGCSGPSSAEVVTNSVMGALELVGTILMSEASMKSIAKNEAAMKTSESLN